MLRRRRNLTPMTRSAATTVEAYLAELPPERRAVVAQARSLVNAHLPPGYVETMNWGMISWEVPLSRYPVTYNKQPLSYAALAAQKNAYTLYLMAVYTDSADEQRLHSMYEQAGKKLDMGKSCLRFKTFDDLVPDAIAKVVASMPVDAYIAHYEANRKR